MRRIITPMPIERQDPETISVCPRPLALSYMVEFVVETLWHWWRQMGVTTYPSAPEFLIIADGAVLMTPVPGYGRLNCRARHQPLCDGRTGNGWRIRWGSDPAGLFPGEWNYTILPKES